MHATIVPDTAVEVIDTKIKPTATPSKTAPVRSFPPMFLNRIANAIHGIKEAIVMIPIITNG